MADREYDVRAEVLKNLMGRVDRDPYPSTTMLDMIEEMLTPDDVPRYARLLMSKMEDENFPSIPMLQRLRDLA